MCSKVLLTHLAIKASNRGWLLVLGEQEVLLSVPPEGAGVLSYVTFCSALVGQLSFAC